LRLGVSLVRGKPEPLAGLLIVLLKSYAHHEHGAQVKLAVGFSLFRGLTKPPAGLNLIQRHSLSALKIGYAEAVLTLGIPLVGRFSEPFESLGLVYGDSLSVPISFTEIGLSA
jgi:hypothetical protein